MRVDFPAARMIAESDIADGEILARKDSNLDAQDQNLVCYRYTTGQRSEFSVTQRVWDCSRKLLLRLPFRATHPDLSANAPSFGTAGRYPTGVLGDVKNAHIN